MMNKSIVWNYIDTEKATIKAMEDYKIMKKLHLLLSNDTDMSSDIHSFRNKRVKEYLEWFEPAWNYLDAEKRLILREFYMTGNLKSGAGIRLQFQLNYSERQLHRIRGRAIQELSMLLFAK